MNCGKLCPKRGKILLLSVDNLGLPLWAECLLSWKRPGRIKTSDKNWRTLAEEKVF